MANEGEQALICLDEILAGEPKTDQSLFSKCAENLSALRNRMIADRADRTSLEHVNATISVVMAGHFPLGQIPWGELHKARAWLDAINRKHLGD